VKCGYAKADFCNQSERSPCKSRHQRQCGYKSTPFKETIVMGTRPPHVKAPDYLSKSPPVPEPKEDGREPEPDAERPDPVRYGDWELKGVAIDF
jgi:hypothetical protein